VTIHEAITKFMSAHRYLETPEGAYLKCDQMAYAFIRFAQDNGVEEYLQTYEFLVTEGWTSSPNPDPKTYQLRKHDTASFSTADWHCIVEAPDFFIDFTGRQYLSTVNYPHIIQKEKAAGAAGGTW